MNIVVGVSGGIAAYKVVQLVRLLVKDGHEVHVVPTPDALRFVGQPTWEAISRHPVTSSVHEDVAQVRHVALGQHADVVIVAPATANTLARYAAGIADNLLTTTLLATQAPVIVAPAMHTEMWLHPATQHNVAVLRARGVTIVGPASGQLTGDDSGPGRMVEPDELRRAVDTLLASRRDLDGLRVVVSAGGTHEPIDPVRYIGNRSSGRQGMELALAAVARGARVTLVAAHVDGAILAQADRPGITVVSAVTAAELEQQVGAAAEGADVIIMAAAVADYRVATPADSKITKETAQGVPPVITLVENPDILKGLVERRCSGQTVVGFAAEMPTDGETLIERGIRKRHHKGVDLLAVNEVGWRQGFESPSNSVIIIDDRDAAIGETTGTKREVADALLDAIVAHRAR
ncbi:MAG: bifunctional phosphopantothenoylcysteine decarboxylase/phosphopantothenate--cysteine ligase CoaBC [Microbacterium sp.]